MSKKEIKKPFRKFLAEEPISPIKTDNKEENTLAWNKFKAERRFYNKHLKAYLKGFSRFPFGRDVNGNQKFHPVQQEYLDKK